MVKKMASEEEFDTQVATGFTIVDFTAAWCAPCKKMSPFFTALSKKYTSIKFIKVDVDELDEVTDKAGVTAVPAFVMYSNGEVIDRCRALKEEIEAMVVRYTPKPARKPAATDVPLPPKTPSTDVQLTP